MFPIIPRREHHEIKLISCRRYDYDITTFRAFNEVNLIKTEFGYRSDDHKLATFV